MAWNGSQVLPVVKQDQAMSVQIPTNLADMPSDRVAPYWIDLAKVVGDSWMRLTHTGGF